MTTLRVILNDQLSENISSLENCKKSQDIIFMSEAKEEYTYVKHHKKKIVFLISAMRHFKEQLLSKGYNVVYTEIDDENNTGSISTEVERIVKENGKIMRIIITHPGEYRALQYVNEWQEKYGLPVIVMPDDRFLSNKNEFNQWANGRKQLRMEYFYREMRKKYCILMNGTNPVGGKWNYDSENRKLPQEDLNIPNTYQSKVDDITNNVINIVDKLFSDHFGDINPFYFAVTRNQALEALNKFINQRLKYFGDYQDAMIEGEPWMYHSHISFYINCGLLSPLECIKAAETSYYKNQAPLNAVEGFIRQILGWREYIKGIYWLKMPQYSNLNFLDAQKNLPDFYWTANTKMNCLRQCVLETKKNAYAHHIQRLMVLGNFALIAGLSPKQVNEWFLIVYADAYEWVELPNVTGMILFADGGLLGSKPYASGGNYINKMSNYCNNCSYKVNEKNGSNACPFNYLYWNFLVTNREKLENNPRIAMMYKSYDRMTDEKKKAIKYDSNNLLNSIKSNKTL